MNNTRIKEKLTCYHCGEECSDTSISNEDKVFCCTGCKTVFEILNQNDLCKYYSIEQTPGISFKDFQNKRFGYLDDESVVKKLLDYRDDKLNIITFSIPQMHCSSCIWLLENLFKINEGINHSEVNFLKKELIVRFNPERISLKELVQLLSSIGYEPDINLESVEKKEVNEINKKLYYKIGIAAFCFGNIMLFSFPEYFSIDISDAFLKRFFSYLVLIFSVPVFIYSASEYYTSAIKGLRKKIINIDFPISLGIFVLFLRSAFEILTNTGAGYSDSLTGLVFFLLLGKLFQNKTYERINFERNYKSYFPLSVLVKKNKEEKSIPVSNLSVGDRIIIRNNEIIPADSILFYGNGNIDYSFVTGESKPVKKVLGELIYAGGKQIGEVLELEVVKDVSQSYLTQLWNNDTFKKKDEGDFTALSNIVSKYFTVIILLIASFASIIWLPINSGTALNVFTSVLIVACPCALALSTPFTLGNTLRIFGKNKFYMKNTNSIEELAKVDEIVFDKTGTLTKTNNTRVEFIGIELNEFQQGLVKSLVKNSTHPLSRKIYDYLTEIIDSHAEPDTASNSIKDFQEFSGKGIEATVLGNKIKIGSSEFVSGVDYSSLVKNETRVYLSINNAVTGYFNFSNEYRAGIKELIGKLNKHFSVSLLSGDNEGEKKNLKQYFNEDSIMLFNQSPQLKLDYIKSLQAKNKKVLMIGDGLNDAGALAQSNIGIAITEDTNNFSPACDAIIDGSRINKIPSFLEFSRTSTKIIIVSFVISFAYNLVGLSFAVLGLLSPVIAAILMPLSSISVVIFATVSTNLIARRRDLLFQ